MVLKELEIVRNSGKPVSEQIASFVRSKIYRREIKTGDKLPTTVELMEQFGVGSNTIRQAIQSLKKEGLVKPVPRLGTIVNGIEAEASPANGFSSNHSEAVIAVAGLMQTTGGVVRFRPETAQGIISECGRLGVSMVVLPESALSKGAGVLYDKLSDLGCKGLVYNQGALGDEEIDYLAAKGIETVTARRLRYKDGRACVESDFDGAGYDVGLYYYSLPCNKVTIFSHYELTCDPREAAKNGYTLGLKHGIFRAYESKGANPDIDFFVHKPETIETSKSILLKLESIPSSTGIVFTNGYQLLNIFKEFPDQTQKLLGDKNVTVISNRTINLEFERYVQGINLMVLLDLYEEMGKKTVSMLVGMIEGYLPKGSTTLSDIRFVPFNEITR